MSEIFRPGRGSERNFNSRSDENIIPRRDSESFLNSLSDPCSEESKNFRQYSFEILHRRLEKTLMNKDKPTIGFSSTPYKGDSSIKFHKNRLDKNGYYILKDPPSFFRMIDERPKDFKTDCLNIIPISVIGATRELLIERGYRPQNVDHLFKNMTIHGEHTKLIVDGQTILPFARMDKYQKLYKESNFLSFSKAREGPKASLIYDKTGIVPSSVKFNVDTCAGDFFFATNRAFENRKDYGNSDDQNGIILKESTAGTPGNEIKAFAHMKRAEERSSSLGEIFKMLGDEATRRGVSMPDYLKMGSIGFEIVNFDYSGFYAKLARSLNKFPSK